jgi:hypothetical protein
MELIQLVVQILGDLLQIALVLLRAAGVWAVPIAWAAWWLWGVNWGRLWPVLAEGGWAPLVLLGLSGAMVWAQLAPSDCDCLGFVVVPNFWWQAGAVGLLLAGTLFLGWLQGVMQWAPPEISLDPPAHHGHDGHH